MPYKNSKELVEFLKKENLWADKDLGQNFLVNFSILKKIIKAAELKPEDNVVEIGPGLGILTKELAKNVSHVHAIELDKNLIKILQRELASFSNINLEQGNALKSRLPVVSYKLVANIPYYITSPLLRHFLQPINPEEKRPTLIVLLVQKEVAKKNLRHRRKAQHAKPPNTNIRKTKHRGNSPQKRFLPTTKSRLSNPQNRSI